MDIAHLIRSGPIYALPVHLLRAITLHAAAHACAARCFGDDSAPLKERISLNPFKRIDPVGTILVGPLPIRQAHMLVRIEPWGLLIVSGLALVGVVGPLWLNRLTALAG